MVEVNRALLVHLLEAMVNDRFMKTFSVVALNVGQFLDLVVKVNVPAAKSI